MPRRLIGIDLAWGEKNGTGCAELAWRGDELELRRIDVMGTLEEIVAWIEPQRGDWVVAVDAPLVVLNQTPTAADADVSAKYGRFEAGAYPANLNNPNLGPSSKAGHLLSALLAGRRDVGGPCRRCEQRPTDVRDVPASGDGRTLRTRTDYQIQEGACCEEADRAAGAG